ncbi:hypothetical protein K439DRAFT_1570142 [Ramaria rubella]|nr:hypothetical protein K439DRAFT_1570142 [Ramaria rubella]
MPSPKHRKKPVTSIQSLDADLGVAQTNDSRVLRQAFNFDTSDSLGPINSGGKKTADHQREIASSLLQNDPSGQWVSTHVKTLGIVIKNRINALKKKYLELYNELGSTGHGLIEDDREDEIWADSIISNVSRCMKIRKESQEYPTQLRYTNILIFGI